MDELALHLHDHSLESRVVLVHGFCGTGKSSLVKEACKDCAVFYFDPLLPGDTDSNIRNLATEMNDSCYGEDVKVMVVDDADHWFSKTSQSLLVLTLVDVVSQLSDSCKVVLITSNIESLHSYVMKCVDALIECPVPSIEQRFHAWSKFLKLTNREISEELNSRCSGWVFSDIASVCANDGPFCLEKKIMDHVPVVFQQGQAPWSLVKSDMIKTTWNDMGGLAAVKKCLREMILWPKM